MRHPLRAQMLSIRLLFLSLPLSLSLFGEKKYRLRIELNDSQRQHSYKIQVVLLWANPSSELIRHDDDDDDVDNVSVCAYSIQHTQTTHSQWNGIPNATTNELRDR